jgi:hypothetical protein
MAGLTENWHCEAPDSIWGIIGLSPRRHVKYDPPYCISGAGIQAANLSPLYDNNSALVECYSIANFQVGSQPGTIDSWGWTNRRDHIFISRTPTSGVFDLES